MRVEFGNFRQIYFFGLNVIYTSPWALCSLFFSSHGSNLEIVTILGFDVIVWMYDYIGLINCDVHF